MATLIVDCAILRVKNSNRFDGFLGREAQSCSFNGSSNVKLEIDNAVESILTIFDGAWIASTWYSYRNLVGPQSLKVAKTPQNATAVMLKA